MTHDISQPETPPKNLAPDLKRWAIALAGGMALLLGRYDWSRDHRAVSLEGFLASSWMLMLVLPAAFYATEILCGRRAAVILTAILGILCVMPYRWLGFA